jgi:hypothetical protein
MMEYEGLWTRGKSGVYWYDRITAEQRTWVDGLVEEIRVHGEPNWSRVATRFEELWPGESPARSTITDHVRRQLV